MTSKRGTIFVAVRVRPVELSPARGVRVHRASWRSSSRDPYEEEMAPARPRHDLTSPTAEIVRVEDLHHVMILGSPDSSRIRSSSRLSRSNTTSPSRTYTRTHSAPGVFLNAAHAPPVKRPATQAHRFECDCCFSSDPHHSQFATQETVFETIGVPAVENFLEGYNACILAYGQTGSGKTYSMLGPGWDDAVETYSPRYIHTRRQVVQGLERSPDKGILLRACEKIFSEIQRIQLEEESGACSAVKHNTSVSVRVEVTYYQIYNEKVWDLLSREGKQPKKVREHKILGPFIQDLKATSPTTFEDVVRIIEIGNQNRKVAQTIHNMHSSRSHAIFKIRLVRERVNTQEDVTVYSRESVFNLVDLSGSERILKGNLTMPTPLSETVDINRSLSCLGKVIHVLSERAFKKQKPSFVPYRDSILTWLLKDCFGGNSRTFMLSTISPLRRDCEETLSTLRYSSKARGIVNCPVLNEDTQSRLIARLQDEIRELRAQIAAVPASERHHLAERLRDSENIVQNVKRDSSWAARDEATTQLLLEWNSERAMLTAHVTNLKCQVEEQQSVIENLKAALRKQAVSSPSEKSPQIGTPQQQHQNEIHEVSVARGPISTPRLPSRPSPATQNAPSRQGPTPEELKLMSAEKILELARQKNLLRDPTDAKMKRAVMIQTPVKAGMHRPRDELTPAPVSQKAALGIFYASTKYSVPPPPARLPHDSDRSLGCQTTKVREPTISPEVPRRRRSDRSPEQAEKDALAEDERMAQARDVFLASRSDLSLHREPSVRAPTENEFMRSTSPRTASLHFSRSQSGPAGASVAKQNTVPIPTKLPSPQREPIRSRYLQPNGKPYQQSMTKPRVCSVPPPLLGSGQQRKISPERQIEHHFRRTMNSLLKKAVGH